MIKQAYLRGLTKKAANTNLFNSYDDRWARTGIASLATLIGSKALGAGWGTAGTLAALAGTGAYNTHNYDAIKNRLTQWLGMGKKEQTPAPAPKPAPTSRQMAESAQAQQDMAQQMRRQDIKDKYKQYINAGVPEQRIFETLDDTSLTPQQQQMFLDGLKRQAQFGARIRAAIQRRRNRNQDKVRIGRPIPAAHQRALQGYKVGYPKSY